MFHQNEIDEREYPYKVEAWSLFDTRLTFNANPLEIGINRYEDFIYGPAVNWLREHGVDYVCQFGFEFVNLYFRNEEDAAGFKLRWL